LCAGCNDHGGTAEMFHLGGRRDGNGVHVLNVVFPIGGNGGSVVVGLG
jgi:hypothetical protein